MKLHYMIAGAALLAAWPAQAAEYIITYKGQVVSSFDGTGDFGVVGGTLDNLDFTAVFTLTVPLPGAIAFDNGTTGQIQGGAVFGAPSPISATLTINNVTQAFGGNYDAYATQVNDSGASSLDRIDHFAHHKFSGGGTSLDTTIRLGISSTINDFVLSSNYTDNLTYTSLPGDSFNGNFGISELTNFDTTVSRVAYGQLRTTSVTIAAAPIGGAVPEPATWALMIVGFGFVAGALRRQGSQGVRVRYG